MVKQSGTIGCVLMELNLVYDVACCLFALILYAPTARISPSNINAPSQKQHTFDDENRIIVSRVVAAPQQLRSSSAQQTIKDIINF